MRKTVATAMLLAVLTATVPAAAQEAPARQGAFAPLSSPNPGPVVVSSIDPATASEGTASIVANPEILTPIVAPAQVAAPATGVPAPGVVSFTVPVPVPAAMAYQQPQRYPQQDLQQQQQLQQLQQARQLQYEQQLQQQAYQRQLYEEQLRQYQIQQEYARQNALRQQQLADQQQQLQQQLQMLDQQRQQIAAQAEAARQEALALQQQPVPVAVPGQPYNPALPYAPVRQFDPNAPIPPQPPMLLPPAPPVPPVPPASFVPPLTPPQFAAPATRPLPAEDFVNTFRNPSTGGDHPVLALITPAEVKQALRQGVRLVMLDVRDGLARDVEGIIPGSVSVPYEPYETFAARVTRVIPLRGDFPVVVFCSDGTASAKATEVLAKMGYSAYLMGAYRLWADIPQQPFAATALQPY